MDEYLQRFLAADNDLIDRYQQTRTGITKMRACAEFEVIGEVAVDYMGPIAFAAGTQYQAILWNFEIINQTQGAHYLRTVARCYPENNDPEMIGTLKFPVLKGVHDLERFKEDPRLCVKTNNPTMRDRLELEAELYLDVTSQYIDLKMNMPLQHPTTKETVETFLDLMEKEIRSLGCESEKRFFSWREKSLHKAMQSRLEMFGMQRGLLFE